MATDNVAATLQYGRALVEAINARSSARAQAQEVARAAGLHTTDVCEWATGTADGIDYIEGATVIANTHLRATPAVQLFVAKLNSTADAVPYLYAVHGDRITAVNDRSDIDKVR